MIVGVVADLHCPFEHPKYLPWVKRVFRKYGVNSIVFAGDIADNHATSRYDPDPDGLSCGDELAAARRHVARWRDAFPKAKVCVGNHDVRPFKRAFTGGLSANLLRTLAEVWQTPGWTWGDSFVLDNVLYTHGDGRSGAGAARQLALQAGRSVVVGHIHAHAGVVWAGRPRAKPLFALNVGCGIDEKAYVFAYGKTNIHRPVLGCGVVVHGKEAFFIPM